MNNNLLLNRIKFSLNNDFKKSIALLFFVSLISFTVNAQTGSVGVGTNTPYANAILDVSSNSKGVLLPKLSAADRNILTPKLNNTTANGLLIYNTTTLKFNYWDGVKWNDVGESIPGPAGADGTTWYAGQGVPSNSLGKGTDFYLDNITGDVFQKDISNTWVRFSGANPVNLKNANKREVSGASFSVPSNGAIVQTYSFTGASVNNAAVCSPSFSLPNGIIISYARVSNTNEIEVKYYNATGSNITVPAGNYQIAIIK